MIRPDVFHIFLKLSKRKFISILVLTIGLAMFLNCVIGQVDHTISKVFGGELFGGCADIALFVPVASKVTV